MGKCKVGAHEYQHYLWKVGAMSVMYWGQNMSMYMNMYILHFFLYKVTLSSQCSRVFQAVFEVDQLPPCVLDGWASA